MTKQADDPLAYYRRELDYLRNAGREFARKHPEMAGRLELSGMESPDPHVERLIESFAFLTGRIRRDLDSEFPKIAGALLEALHPNFMTPVPAMTVVRFAPDLRQGGAASARQVRRGTALHAFGRRERTPGVADVICQFRTCYDVDVWPLGVPLARLEDARSHPGLKSRPDVAKVLRVRLQCSQASFGGKDGQIAPDRLRFHLYGDWSQVNPLYELLLCNVTEVQLARMDATAEERAAAAVGWHEVGFEAEHAVLPVVPNAHPAYRLLQEYFAFPRKFMFFDASGLRAALEALGGAQAGPLDCVDLLFLIGGQSGYEPQVQASQFQLGCTPAINLFERTAEAIRLDQRRVEYRINADVRRETTTEIHSILSVEAAYADGQRGKPLAPYISASGRNDGPAWIARRDHAIGERMRGTDLFLSFANFGLDGATPEAAPLISAKVLCTNRNLAESIRPDPPGADPAHATFRADADSGVLPASCLYQPTRQLAPPLDGETLWRLSSLLNLNQVSLDQLAGQEDRHAALHQLLDLCNTGNTVAGARQIRALKEIKCKSVVWPVRDGPAPGFRRGVELELRFKRDDSSEGAPLMLAAVLQRFIPLYVSVNSFASVTVMDGNDKVKEWPPSIN